MPKTLYSKKLSSPYDDDMRTDFKDMVELVADEDLLLSIDNGDKVDFWSGSSITHFKNLLEDRKISFHPTYAEANFEELRMISIPVYKKKAAKKNNDNKKQEDQEEKEKVKHHIRIRLLPKEAPMLDRACNIYSEKFGKKLDYKGETGGAIMARGVEVDIITKRIHIEQETKDILMERQNGRCS